MANLELIYVLKVGIDFKVSVSRATITSIICSHFDENVI